MKTLIAVPCMDEVATPFAMSLATLTREGECVISMVANSMIYDSRNKIAAQAIEAGADYVMWIDSDMTFLPDTLQRMLRHMEDGKDFVTGLCFRRKSPFEPVLFKTLEWDGTPTCEKYNKYPKDSVFEVAGCGFGCVMTRTTVIADVLASGEPLFTPLQGVGEDLSFCFRARKLGYKIFCDSTIKCGHVGQILINEAFYEQFRGNK